MEQAPSRRLTHRCRVWVNGVWVVKIVVRMNVGSIEHGAGCAGDAGSVDDNLSGQGLVEVWVHDREGDLLAIPCRRDGGRAA